MSVPASTDDKRSTPAELWARKDVLAYFGGKRPLHTSTLYRGIQEGLYPRPIRVSRTHVRWLRRCIPHRSTQEQGIMTPNAETEDFLRSKTGVAKRHQQATQ